MADARKYAASSFIKIEDVEDKPMRECIVHVKEGQYGKLEALLESGRKLGLNGTSVGALMSEFGTDYEKWSDKDIEIYAGQVKYQGSLKDAVLARPLDGEPLEAMSDAKGPPIEYPDGPDDPDDEIPF
jgi:hypothetical protein